MGLRVSGVEMQGLKIIGSEFLEPLQIPNCIWYYKWKEGITLNVGKVSYWANQSTAGIAAGVGGAYQNVVARQPAYDAVTGIIRGDGVDDYLIVDCALGNQSVLDSAYTYVFGPPIGSAGVPVSRDRGGLGGFDANALQLNMYGSYFQSSMAFGTGAYVRTDFIWTSVTSQPVTVVTFRKNSIYVNGVNSPLLINSKLSYQAAPAAYDGRWNFLAGVRNNAGVPGTPNNPGRIAMYELCWHTGLPTNLQITKLHNYFKQKHAIL